MKTDNHQSANAADLACRVPEQYNDDIAIIRLDNASVNVRVNREIREEPAFVSWFAGLRRAGLKPSSPEFVMKSELGQGGLANTHDVEAGISGAQRDVRRMFRDVISLSASDIHVHLDKRQGSRIRTRINGLLYTIREPDFEEGERCCLRWWKACATPNLRATTRVLLRMAASNRNFWQT